VSIVLLNRQLLSGMLVTHTHTHTHTMYARAHTQCTHTHTHTHTHAHTMYARARTHTRVHARTQYPSPFIHLYDCDYYNYLNIQYRGTALLLLVNHAYCIETIAPHAPLTYLSSEKKTLRYQICSTCYAAVQINNCLKRTFIIKVATTKIIWKPSRTYH